MSVMRTDGLSVYGHVITKFSRMGRLLHFLTHGALLARFAREGTAIKSYDYHKCKTVSESVLKARAERLPVIFESKGLQV